MIGFKPIDEFTFDDYAHLIEKRTADGEPVEPDIQEQYDNLLSELKAKEDQDYQACRSIESYERFIRKYTYIKATSKYQPQHLEKVTHELNERMFDNRKKIAKYTAIALAILAVICLIGYRPISKLEVSDTTIKLSKYTTRLSVKLNTSAPNVHTALVTVSWLNVSLDGDSLILKATRNAEDLRKTRFVIKAFPTLFGAQLSFLGETLYIDVEQESGYATYLSLTPEKITIPPSGGYKNIHVETDGLEWSIERPYQTFGYHTDSANIEVYAPVNETTRTITEYLTVTSGSVSKDIIIEQRPFEYFPDGTTFYYDDPEVKKTATYYSDGRCYEHGLIYVDDFWTKGQAKGKYYIDNGILYVTWEDCSTDSCELGANYYRDDYHVYYRSDDH